MCWRDECLRSEVKEEGENKNRTFTAVKTVLLYVNYPLIQIVSLIGKKRMAPGLETPYAMGQPKKKKSGKNVYALRNRKNRLSSKNPTSIHENEGSIRGPA